jgi:hypothetical protein
MHRSMYSVSLSAGTFTRPVLTGVGLAITVRLCRLLTPPVLSKKPGLLMSTGQFLSLAHCQILFAVTCILSLIHILLNKSQVLPYTCWLISHGVYT